MQYELIPQDPGLEGRWIRRLSDGAVIPVDPGNRDFQDFLEWNEQQPPEQKINWE